MIELYAITDHPGPPLPDLPRLNVIARDRLAAVCAPASSGAVTPEALWRHEEVVEALMRGRDLLPVRYGTRVEDEAAAARAVSERYEEFVVALERVRGAVELSVRVLAAEERVAAADPEPGSGADYLRAKARSAVGRERALSTLHEPLSLLARESRLSSARSPAELLRGAYLVDRTAVDRFVRLVARLQAGSPSLRLLCTGPWPPYGFAER